MFSKWIFDRSVAFLGLVFLWPLLVVIAIMVKVRMPGGTVLFVQKRIGKDGKLFNCHKFRTMTVNHNGSTVSVAGDSRFLVFGMCSSAICLLLVHARMCLGMRINFRAMTEMC